MPGLRFSFMTLNLWQTSRWPDREPALSALLAAYRPDLFGVQELKPPLLQAIEAALPTHARVHDAGSGWADEGNLFWNAALFEEVAHGSEHISDANPHRQLFWVRLRVRDTGRTLLAATAHFTWPGHRIEKASGQSPRPDEARRTAAALQRLANPHEPVFFCGDLNEHYYPPRILAEHGYVDCFKPLSLPVRPTRPARPIDERPDQAIDWIMANDRARPIAAHVVHFYKDGLPPSDHWPVIAVYEIKTG